MWRASSPVKCATSKYDGGGPNSDESGYEWVVFTATQELIGIFTKLGLPLLALAKADPARLGSAADDWGSYYDAAPVVVAGRIRIALERFGSAA